MSMMNQIPGTPAASHVVSERNRDVWSNFSSQQTPQTSTTASMAAAGMTDGGGPKLLEGYLRLRGRHTYEAPVEAAQEAIQNENPRQWMKTWCILTRDTFRWGPASTMVESSATQNDDDQDEDNIEYSDEAALEFLSSGLSSKGLIRCQSIETLLEEREYRMFILGCRMGAVILQCPGQRSVDLWSRAFNLCLSGAVDEQKPLHTQEQPSRITDRSSEVSHENHTYDHSEYSFHEPPETPSKEAQGNGQNFVDYEQWHSFALGSLNQWNTEGVDPKLIEQVAGEWARATAQRRGNLWEQLQKR
eukprot:gb/GECG01014148.1/.p1 GENE.gb/GECG01014148.1/~~gb/GECG01014148.1/.p1  ORF type:complete len:303 (+),score=39.21 gb/GECG01014148.1/:1-909(+)